MGAFVRRVLPALFLALAAGMAVRAAAPDLQASLRDKFFSALKPEQQKGLTKSSPIDQLIGKMDLQQRQSAAGQLPALESQFPDPKSLSEIGSAYLKLGSFSEAARIAADLKAKYPNDASGPLLEAKAKAESGDKEGAIAAAQQAVMADPNNGEALAYFKLLRNGTPQSSKVPLPTVTSSGNGSRRGVPGTLDGRQAERVNHALSVLRRSANGKRIIIAIVPDSDGNVTEADLREHGVQLVAKQEPVGGRAFGKVEKTVIGGQEVYVVSFNNAVIAEQHDSRDVAAFLGGKLDRVATEKEGAAPPGSILLEWRERVAQAYILIDLGVTAFANASSSLFTQESRLNERIQQGNLTAKPLDTSAGENYGEGSIKWFDTVAATEANFGAGLFENLLRLIVAKNPQQSADVRAVSPGTKSEFSEHMARDFRSN